MARNVLGYAFTLLVGNNGLLYAEAPPPSLPPRPVHAVQAIQPTSHPIIVNLAQRGSWVHKRDPNAPLGSLENPYPDGTFSVHGGEERQVHHVPEPSSDSRFVASELTEPRPQSRASPTPTIQTHDQPAQRRPPSPITQLKGQRVGRRPLSPTIGLNRQSTEKRPPTPPLQANSQPAQRGRPQVTTKDETPKSGERHVHFEEGPDSVRNSPVVPPKIRLEEADFRYVQPFARTERSGRTRERQQSRGQRRPSKAPSGDRRTTLGQNSYGEGSSVQPDMDRHQPHISASRPRSPRARPRSRSRSHPKRSPHSQTPMRPAHGISPRSDHATDSEPHLASSQTRSLAEPASAGAERWPNCSICEAQPTQVSDDGVNFCFKCYGEARAMDVYLSQGMKKNSY